MVVYEERRDRHVRRIANIFKGISVKGRRDSPEFQELSGRPVQVFQSRYTIAIVYRLMFFMHRRMSRYTPPQGPPKLGYRKIMLDACWSYRSSSYRLDPIAL